MPANMRESPRGLKSFFNPGSVALIGATDKPGSVGRVVLENLVSAPGRRVYPVNPNHSRVLDQPCFPEVKALPEIPDLAVIVTPAETVPELVEKCGKSGVGCVTVISSGFKEIGKPGEERESKIRDIISRYRMRLLGPNCMGAIRPSANLNSTFVREMPKAGYIAFLSQSGGVGAGILDWAIRRNIGFSAFVSLGSMLDIDFSDLIDYFGEDPETRSIIIYPESLGNVRNFMIAARCFARSKPIIVLKPGKFQESARAAKSHTGSLVGNDLHYDAIFRRAGAVRVEELRDFFNCAAILNTAKLPGGPNVAIVTNGGGAGLLAVDNLIGHGGKLAALSEASIAELDRLIPSTWSRDNPIDIREDADVTRYIKAVEVAVNDPAVHGVLVIYTPQGNAVSSALAREMAKMANTTSKPMFMVWIGAHEVTEARQIIADSNVPVFRFPEEAVKAYLYMWQYARNLDMLYQTPEESIQTGSARNHLKTVIGKAVRDGRFQLSEEDTARFLSSYRIPSTTPHLVRTPIEAERAASRMGFPIILKIASGDIIHKSEAGGVSAKISSIEEVRPAFNQIMANVATTEPGAKIDGIVIHKFLSQYDYELMVGAKKDPFCGPVIMFGLGGVYAEFFKDFAVGLPPLNQALAMRIMEQTRIFEMLVNGFRNRPPVDIRMLTDILVKVSDMVVDFPEIKELDINPIAVTGNSVMALDSRIILDEDAVKNEVPEYGHLIITPYPSRYVVPFQCEDGRRVLLRPIKPEDEPREKAALQQLSPESLRLRFFSAPYKISHEMLIRFCNIDYNREMVIVAQYDAGGKRCNVGNSCLFMQPNGLSGEFAVYVAEDFRNVGLGLKLMDMLIGIAREKGARNLFGFTMKENAQMIELARRLGFTIEIFNEEEVKMSLELQV